MNTKGGSQNVRTHRRFADYVADSENRKSQRMDGEQPVRLTVPSYCTIPAYFCPTEFLWRQTV